MINCGRVARRKHRCPSDTSDEQWELIEPLLPQVNRAGRPEKHPRRAGGRNPLRGADWVRVRQLPADFPPWQTSAGLIDSQSVKGADTVGWDSRGYDAGKKINGRMRFIVTDTPP